MANVGSIDRAVRFVLGVALLAAPFVPPVAAALAGWGNWIYLLAVAGIVMIGTAAFRFCPAYTLFGIRTCAAGHHGHGGRR
ncbi:MAG: DUF2892 domain-containing protein [Alphaproteobacteria bacterium]